MISQLLTGHIKIRCSTLLVVPCLKFWAILLGVAVFGGCNPRIDSQITESIMKPDNSNENKNGERSHLNMKQAERELEKIFLRYYSTDPHYVQVKNGLIFSIPSNYRPTWLLRGNVQHSAEPQSRIPKMKSLGFQMFFPDFSGYTRENYKDEFHPDRINVTVVEPVPKKEYLNNPAAYDAPEVVIKRLGDVGLIDLDRRESRYGIVCYRNKISKHESYVCSGNRVKGEAAIIEVDEYPQSGDWPPNPRVRVRYFTQQFGGMRIRFDFSRMYIERWQDVDEAVWNKIQTWHFVG